MKTAIAQIAIVDDDPSVGRAVGRLVRSLGMQSETFTSGEAFFRAVAASWKPDCVVLDVQMPGMNGLEVQLRIVEQELAVAGDLHHCTRGSCFRRARLRGRGSGLSTQTVRRRLARAIGSPPLDS